MVRVSEDQYSLLQRNTEGKPVLRGPAAKRAPRRKEDLPENQVEAQITSYLNSQGWICTKQHAGLFSRFDFKTKKKTVFTIGETGQADWRAERPIIPPGARVGPSTTFAVELFYFETKAPGKKPLPHQQAWLNRRQLTGITANWFDSLEAFLAWYRRHYGMRGGDPPQIRET